MKRLHALVAVVAALCGASAVIVEATTSVAGDDRSVSAAPAAQGAVVSAPSDAGDDDLLERTKRDLGAKRDTWKDVGAFGLRGGRKVRLHTTDAANGKSCIIEDEASGASTMCVDRSLFDLHSAAFFVNSNGGPERFGDLHLSGVAAPGVASVVLVKSDGSSTDLALNDQRAFLYESTASELERDVEPAALRLFGRNGKLVERIEIAGEH